VNTQLKLQLAGSKYFSNLFVKLQIHWGQLRKNRIYLSFSRRWILILWLSIMLRLFVWCLWFCFLRHSFGLTHCFHLQGRRKVWGARFLRNIHSSFTDCTAYRHRRLHSSQL